MQALADSGPLYLCAKVHAQLHAYFPNIASKQKAGGSINQIYETMAMNSQLVLLNMFLLPPVAGYSIFCIYFMKLGVN